MLLLLCLAVGHALPYNDLGQRAPPAPPAHNRQLEHLYRLEDLSILPRTPKPDAVLLSNASQRAPPAAAHFAKDPSYGYTWCERPDLELELRSRFRELLRDNEGLFARSLKELGCYSAKCIELRDAGIIKPSTSAHYALNHTMPAKKDEEGNWTDSRFCCDARPLNAATRPDMYRPPLPEELFDKVGTAT
ncbi:hypothetical protein TSOC_013120 [Tetrabaena socialis]|uniref:Uncharacterized protein n=1 Tax=Tetrabaena socialis TaxID=47790 RepID=A0A2J7ZL80_9CHLO|nr:hypothetical protein TSOC_013120 [Tetrabaena socialis]|eukprot:PNH01022.1 hypothetical protein TSOC_013120 [Tetrabaena socialis]